MTDETPGPGHNSGVAADQLRSLIERVERMEAEKADITGAIREIYAEAKGNGFDPKIMREVVRIRRMDKADREEHAALLELYCGALGI